MTASFDASHEKGMACSYSSNPSSAGKTLRPSLLAFSIAQALAMPVMAADILVDNNGDSATGSCTLRQAIISANTNAVAPNSNCVAGTAAADTISFTNSVVGTGTIQVTQPQMLRITPGGPLVIDGPDSAPLTVNGMGNAGVFYGDGTIVTMNNLTIVGGVATFGGGAIYTLGSTVTLNNSTISGNASSQQPNCLDGVCIGGGIYLIQSTIDINQTTISGNSIGGGIAALSYSVVRLNNSTVSGNVRTGGAGGGISIDDSDLSIINSTVSGNSAATSGGGINLSGSSTDLTLSNTIVAGNEAPAGAEISDDSLPATAIGGNNLLGDSSNTFAQAFDGFTPSGTDIIATSDGSGAQPAALSTILNPLGQNGGDTKTHGLPSDSPAINAADGGVCTSAPINSQDQRGLVRNSNCDIGAFELLTSIITVNRMGDTPALGECTLREAILSSNSAGLSAVGGCAPGGQRNQIEFDPNVFPTDGATILLDGSSLQVQSTELILSGESVGGLTIDAQEASRVFEIAGAEVSLSQLTIKGGSSIIYGGGIYAASSDVALTSSTVMDNSALTGGGIYATNTNLNVGNSTISNNVAGANGGGGIKSVSGSTVSVINSTLSGNSTSQFGGGIYASDSTVTLRNNLIVGNNADSNLGGDEIRGNNSTTTFTTSNNLFGDSSHSYAQAFSEFMLDGSDTAATNDGPNAEPATLNSILKPLADNGGPSLTHALTPNSAAIDAGDNSVCENEPINNVDQRGVQRPIGDTCDIGAYEAEQDSQFFVVPLPNGKVISFSL